MNNQALTEKAQKHYLSHRARCIECSQNFCKKCKELPYHSGFDCQTFQIFKNAAKCRFCGIALMPDVLPENPSLNPALKDVCNSKICLQKRDEACDKTLPCGHFCNGICKEEICMPCIHSCCNDKPIYITQVIFCNFFINFS